MLAPVESLDENFKNSTREQSSVSTKSIAEQWVEREGSNQMKKMSFKFCKLTVGMMDVSSVL